MKTFELYETQLIELQKKNPTCKGFENASLTLVNKAYSDLRITPARYYELCRLRAELIYEYSWKDG